MKLIYPPGATPLDPDEIADLIPEHITTQGELNEWEQANILKAEMWLSGLNVSHPKGNVANHNTSTNIHEILTTPFIQQVHKKMFDKTWRWAGKFRKSNKNIGIDWVSIPTALYQLLEDIKYQTTNRTYEIDEIAARLHHRLVAIQPFPNGNGRHARLVTDFSLIKNNAPRFSWGRTSLSASSDVRKKYIQALQAADKHNYTFLLDFIRA